MELELRKKRAEIVLKTLKKLFPTTQSALNYSNELEFLIAVILSAQCTDKKVNEVTEKLFKKYPTLQDYNKADFEEFCQDIRQTGFYKNKAKNVLATTKKIAEEFNGKVPQEMDELLTLSGVARKTANVVMGEIFGKMEGVAVDTHVIRLSQKFNLTDKQDQGKIEKDLMEILPQKEWLEFTHRIIDYGRQYSPAHKKEDNSDPVSQALLAENLL
ncbi:endonuclease III [Candidatus Woesebacteria bacterium]|nr:endonuclease III [Candidatus Woesebacteria bacterium]